MASAENTPRSRHFWLTTMAKRSVPDLPSIEIERACWQAGWRLVAGVDEVGRGALAGPLVAAAVVLPIEVESRLDALRGLTDSKLLTPAQRDRWYDAIHKTALALGVGLVECGELDEIGVGPANRIAMERAVLALPLEPDVLVLDATVVDLGIPQVGFIDGDAICLSIAAASIVAKVTRDRIMATCEGDEPRYGFAVHKGYGTPAHLAALRRHGPGPLHRRCFDPVASLLMRN